MKFGGVVFVLCESTDIQTDIFIAIICTSPMGEVSI